MFLHFQAGERFSDLHLTTRMNDWDMSEEIKLSTTTDQYYRESVIKPHLWLMVNPALVCPIKYPYRATSPPLDSPASEISPTSVQQPAPLSPPDEDESLHDVSFSSEQLGSDEDYESSVEVSICHKLKNAQKAQVSVETMRKVRLAQSKRLQRVLKDCNNLKAGAWPRPPVNYCILIAMALSSSRSGSLNVQQIYNFTREHFPFFQTAPDGWKNTIRHNLCFSNSFKKTPQQVSSEGKRKSCLWHLTLDGRRRLRNEIHLLTGDPFRILKRSMMYPDMIQALFEL
ncbi:forkhead box protein R1 isoform X2 [Denticeps clupeoides]|uniref:forkhead box protein R1 isoform X2 n=1 Tax=Denticeps clupeoides TaxID=299321 RepID=UPI0010A32DC9|nr:forkhead box protein N5-like isoform X2 [Denticeps clupeoides]